MAFMRAFLLFVLTTAIMADVIDQDILRHNQTRGFKTLQTINASIKDSNVSTNILGFKLKDSVVGFLSKGGVLQRNNLIVDLDNAINFYGFKSESGAIIDNNISKVHLNNIKNVVGISSGGEISANDIRINSAKSIDSFVGFLSKGGVLERNSLRIDLRGGIDFVGFKSQSAEVTDNNISLVIFNNIKNLVGISGGGKISKNNINIDAMSREEDTSADSANLIVAKDADVVANSIEFSRSNVNNSNIITALSSDVYKNSITSRFALNVKNNLNIISTKGRAEQNFIDIKEAFINGTLSIANAQGGILGNQINFKKIKTNADVVGLMSDGDIRDNNITIERLNPYESPKIFSSNHKRQNLILGYSQNGDVVGNVVDIENSMILGDVVGIDSKFGVVSNQWLSVVNSHIFGDLLLSGTKMTKDSTLNLVASKIKGDINAAGSDVNILASNIRANDIKNPKTIQFYLNNDTNKHIKFLELNTKGKVDLRGVKLNMVIVKMSTPRIRVGSSVVLIKARGEIIVDENTTLATLDLDQEKTEEGYEFRLKIRKDELLAVATKSRYKPRRGYMRRSTIPNLLHDIFD